MRRPVSASLILVVLAVGGALLCADLSRQVILTVLRGPFRIVRAAATTITLLPRLPGLVQENAALRAQLMQQQVDAAQLREAFRAATQAQVLLTLPTDRPRVVARVLARSVIPTQHALLIDRGRSEGLTPGAVIVDADGVVGRVVEAQGDSSLVLLVTDPDSRIAAMVERSRETGLLVGRGAGACQLLYLDPDADVREQDRVLTAGLGGAFPKGLLLGVVEHVTRDQVSGTASAKVVPVAGLGRLEEVLCLLVRR